MIIELACIRYGGAIVHRSEPDTYNDRPDVPAYKEKWRTIMTSSSMHEYSVALRSHLEFAALQPFRYEPTDEFTLRVLRILGNLCHGFEHHTLALNPDLPDLRWHHFN